MALLAVTSLRGCDCSDDPFKPADPWLCEDRGGPPTAEDQACGKDERFAKGECIPARCDAGDPVPGCCPGMVCLGSGECVVPQSRITVCPDTPCRQGESCCLRPQINAEQKTCGFLPVSPGELCADGCPPPAADGLCADSTRPSAVSGECPLGGQPFNGRCFSSDVPPCCEPDASGECRMCGPSQVCNIDTNRCEVPPENLPNTDHGCDLQCGDAEILVYSDPDWMLWERCCAVTCECRTLPPLRPGPWGRFSDIALGDDTVFVSGYDSKYGDLVMGLHGRASGQLQTLDYVDGVPTDGPVVGDPTGPRAGRNGEGPNVGTYTSVALYQDAPRIAYYDVDNADLKFALYDPVEEVWSVGLIDDGRDIAGLDTGDVGRFTSLVVDSSGIAHVAYYAHRVWVNGELVTGPMYARSLVSSPVGYDDWERVPIERVRSCNGECGPQEVCVLDGGVPGCVSPRDDCASTCACGESCVDVGGSTCRVAAPLRLSEPCDGVCPTTDYMCVADAAEGNVCRLARDGHCAPPCPQGEECPPECPVGEVCVDDTADNAECRYHTPFSTIGGVPEGVGLFTSLVLYQDKVTVAYYDSMQKQLRGATANFNVNHAATDFHTVSMPVGCGFGADSGQAASMAVAPSGDRFAIAYQGGAGDSLYVYTGAEFTGGTVRLVDNGLRSTRYDLVGANASVGFGSSSDDIYIAYQDQTENDLLLAYTHDGSNWFIEPQLTDGAFGSFASMVIDPASNTAWLSSYVRERDQRDLDLSRLLVILVDLSGLP
ncbi:MAG: hypothetical protein A2289_18960 [Deltaproteobacteria bacterium RIFOXYA12_FULL_58_15]|nr:MAG: hypothetical protein A2289_18960 [Deltaproteobacteria bacterium RIFOXYA12_FULL_58_15]OGR08699.1 MAG: hypothetical protein A2341_00705 [Deltaproteobacteria bacterium RIFOXYB12_FULL_58_9]